MQAATMMDALVLAPGAAAPRRTAASSLTRAVDTRRTAARHVCSARAGPRQSVQQNGSTAAATPSLPDSLLRPDRMLPTAVAAIAAISWYLLRQVKTGKERFRGGAPSYESVLQDGYSASQDGREYRMALARTRQSVAVHRAIGFLNGHNVARAMVEIRRALHENSVCRAPVLNSQLEAADLAKLYRLHLENTAAPADFATLLQLRTMLDLDFDEAERIEQEVMEQGAMYSI